MKRSIIILFVLTFAIQTKSQQFEVKALYGSPSLMDATATILSILGTTFAGTEEAWAISQGTLDVEFYLNSVNRKWQYGIALINGFYKGHYDISKQNLFMVLPTVNHYWTKPERKFRVYSGVSLGVGFLSRKWETDQSEAQQLEQSDTFLGFNLMPVGLRYGRDFGINFELNLVMKPVASLGFSYQF